MIFVPQRSEIYLSHGVMLKIVQFFIIGISNTATGTKRQNPGGKANRGNERGNITPSQTDRSSYVERIKSLSRVFNDEVTNAFLDDFTEDELRRYVQTSTDELRRQAAEIAL